MSIINQMLQDLDRRRASNAERGALPNQARALPSRAAPRRWLWPLVAAVALAAIAAAAWQVSRMVAHVVPPSAMPVPRMTLELAAPPVAAPSPPPPVKPRDVAAAAPQPHIVKPVARPVAALAAEPVAVDAGVKTIQIGATPPAPASNQVSKQVQELTPQQIAENDYRRGVELLGQGQPTAAQSALEDALRLNPAHTAARQALFGLLLEAKKNDAAEQVLQDGLNLDPNQPGFARALASLQVNRGDTAAAIATMQTSAAAAADNADYQAFLAGLLQRAQRHAEAVERYQTALKLAPQSGVWWMGLGISLQALDRKAEARDAFAHARSSNTLTPELQAFVEQRLRQLQ